MEAHSSVGRLSMVVYSELHLYSTVLKRVFHLLLFPLTATFSFAKFLATFNFFVPPGPIMCLLSSFPGSLRKINIHHTTSLLTLHERVSEHVDWFCCLLPIKGSDEPHRQQCQMLYFTMWANEYNLVAKSDCKVRVKPLSDCRVKMQITVCKALLTYCVPESICI